MCLYNEHELDLENNEIFSTESLRFYRNRNFEAILNNCSNDHLGHLRDIFSELSLFFFLYYLKCFGSTDDLDKWWSPYLTNKHLLLWVITISSSIIITGDICRFRYSSEIPYSVRGVNFLENNYRVLIHQLIETGKCFCTSK